MHADNSSDQAIDAQLEQALALHRAKQFTEAEQAYSAILALRRHHPVVNHCLGLLNGQLGQYRAALPYFKTAWSVNPDEGQFWLSYADGLIKAQQPAQALELMQMAISRGLDNDEAQALHQAAQRALDDLNSRHPRPDEEAELIALYQSGQYAALEQAAIRLQDKYPESGFASSVLGTALQLQGKDALAVLRRTVELTPDDAEAHNSLGNALQGADDYPAAVASYRRALALHPDFAEAHSNLGGALQAQGMSQQAADSYRRAIAARPDYAHAHFNLANTLITLGDLPAAADAYGSAARLLPGDAEAHTCLANVLQELGRHGEAAASYLDALAQQPDDLHLLVSAGNCFVADGRAAEAEPCYRRAAELDPDSAEAQLRHGLSLQMQDKFEQALPSLQKAAQLAPDAAAAQSWLAHTLQAAGHAARAAVQYRVALAITPQDPALHNQMGIALHDSGDHEGALLAYRKALEFEPDLARAYGNIGVTEYAQLRYEDACVSYRKAIELDGEFFVARVNLGICLRALSRLHEAAEQFRLARDGCPDYLDAHINLCAVLSELGDLESAVEACYVALATNPDYMPVHSNLLFCLSHLGATAPEELFREHVRFADQFETPLMGGWPQHDNDRDPERVLRVGFVSGDFNRHAVSSFVVPIFEHLCKSPRLSLHAYYANSLFDHATDRVRECLPTWRQVDEMDDEQLLQQIRDDKIDILIDLSGHTNKNRLMTFARKPAPLQASWIGYPGTTGLQAMDYFLTDRHLMPAEFGSQYREKFAYLPASAPFLPAAEAPPVNTLPALTNGYITFGSFNRPNKLSRPVIALWSRLLHAVPGSRLMMAGMPQRGHEVFAEWFAAEGIGAERLNFVPRSPIKEYLHLHYQIDICLDTFPYTGGTTTLHSLWMGVPMLTIAGATMPGRVSAAVLEHLQLDAMIARDADDFVAKGVYLAGALPLLASLRGSMRELLARSALGQPGVIAVGLEGALRVMWQRWCAGLPAETFEVELDPDYAGAQEA